MYEKIVIIYETLKIVTLLQNNKFTLKYRCRSHTDDRNNHGLPYFIPHSIGYSTLVCEARSYAMLIYHGRHDFIQSGFRRLLDTQAEVISSLDFD